MVHAAGQAGLRSAYAHRRPATDCFRKPPAPAAEMNPPSPQPLCFATSNADKLREAREILPITVEGVTMELDELQTTDLREVVRHKAEQAWRRLERPVMVEDTSLVFSAWGALPGVFIKFFLENLGPDGLVAALQPFGDDGAEAVCGVGYHDGGQVHYFEGRVAGRAVTPRGTGGFGWDVILQPRSGSRTCAEMEPGEKHGYSMRGQALAGLAEFLRGGGGAGG